MLFRRHSWTVQLLADVYNAVNGTFVTHPWWEQAALHYLLYEDTHAADRRRHVQLVPQWWLNRSSAKRWIVMAFLTPRMSTVDSLRVPVVRIFHQAFSVHAGFCLSQL